MSTLQPNWSPTEVMIGLGTNELEPAEQPGGQPGPITTAEQAVREELMAIKREAGQFFDRQQAQFDAGIAQHRQSVEQQLRADVDPALFSSVSQAHQSLLEARRMAAQTRQALTQHEAARPRVAADVPAWSRQRTDKVGELEAFEAIAADAEQAHRQAQARVQQALQQAWLKRRTAAAEAVTRRNEEIGREIQARQTELNELRANGTKELERLNDQVNFWDRYGL